MDATFAQTVLPPLFGTGRVCLPDALVDLQEGGFGAVTCRLLAAANINVRLFLHHPLVEQFGLLQHRVLHVFAIGIGKGSIDTEQRPIIQTRLPQCLVVKIQFW